MTYDELRNEILTKGYHEVPFSVPRSAVELAIARYFDFLTLSDEEKNRWTIHLKRDENDRGSELGHWRRQSKTGFGYDDKEFFHYNAEFRNRFRNDPTAPPELTAFIDATEPIYQAAMSSIQSMLDIVGEKYPNVADPYNELSVLRFLKYDRAPAGEFLARGHYDRGGCSLAIAESAPGLRIGHTERDLKEVTHQEGKAFFFPALFMDQKTNGEFPPSWHDVVQKSENAFRPDTARWAIVFFATPNEPSYFDRELVHTSR